MQAYYASHRLIYALAAALLMLGTTAHAQQIPSTIIADQVDSDVLPVESVGWTEPITGDALPGSLSGIDLPTMTKRQWKSLRREQLAAIRSQDEHTWQTALRNIIYLSTFYGDKIDLSRASLPMLEIYILDRDEQYRIMALAGLHAVGSRNAMAHLAQRVKLERSPRVRRLTLAALADHYGLQDYHAPREDGSR